jgi:hypothetical protein
VFGYSDILHLLIGVQQFDTNYSEDPSKGMFPVVDYASLTPSRSFCPEPVKGTYLPQEGNFINKPLFSLLQQFLNPAINEMYTALKVGLDGRIMPTLVVRQIPFSTNAITESPKMLLTRFLDLPRWRISPVLVSEVDIGRSDATHFNLVKVLGDAALFSGGGIQIPARQEVLNPPIFDVIDIARSGVKSYMQTVNCTIKDLNRVGGLRVWSEAIADWTMGSQYTLNGQIQCTGIQAPIAEGDNIEFEDMVYHIEAITDTCTINNGVRSFTTTLALTNGMPKDQKNDKGNISKDFPKYPGFIVNDRELGQFDSKESETNFNNMMGGDTSQVEATADTTSGNNDVATSLDPGMSEDRF